MNQELNERIAEILLGKIESGKIDVNFINKMLEGNLQPENFKGTGMMGVGLYPEMQRPFRKKKVTSLSMEQLNKGESKSIDDIINQSDMAEFLSKAMSDKTNVDSSEIPIDNLDDKSNYYDRGFTRAETEKLKALKEQRRKDKLRFGYQFRDSPLHIINNFFGSEEKDEELILEERGRK